jgi:uncharacterized protein (TIGR02594 family)
VDTDFFRSNELAAVKAYFTAAKAQLTSGAGPHYKLGVYGSGTVATMLLDAGLIDYVWIARASRWSGTATFLQGNRWHLYQNKIELRDGGIDYDTNVTRDGVVDFGQFRLGPHTMAAHEMATRANIFSVSARTTLNLRGGPGLDFGVIRSLANGTQLTGVSRVGKWLQADLEGDGVADGFVHEDFVAPVVGSLELVPQRSDPSTPHQRSPFDVAYEELALDVREVPGPGSNPRITLYYRTMDGAAAPTNDGEVPWCSYFVNFCCVQAGRHGTGKANARSWEAWGTVVTGAPKPGDIAVFWRVSPTDGRGHVGFYVGEDGNDLLILGGNQGDRVSIAPRPKSQLLGFRR